MGQQTYWWSKRFASGTNSLRYINRLVLLQLTLWGGIVALSPRPVLAKYPSPQENTVTSGQNRLSQVPELPEEAPTEAEAPEEAPEEAPPEGETAAPSADDLELPPVD